MKQERQPDHPDFDDLKRIIAEIDRQSESGFEMEQIASAEIDLATLLYAATQRTKMMMAVTRDLGLPPGARLEMVRHATLYLEAFIAGCRFGRQKEREKQVGVQA